MLRSQLIAALLLAAVAAGSAATGATPAPALAAAGRLGAFPAGAPPTPAGGFPGPYRHGPAAPFRAGAAVTDFTPPVHGRAPGGDPADCDHTGRFTGPRQFAFEEPYVDLKGDGHYDPGDPYVDCNGNGRWDG
ncbi:MAG: hypothetical protein JO039_15355, partial [Solirubrobacterales bacterium]|nr:hypothetical protein [Solirubrobacterales bacterium]